MELRLECTQFVLVHVGCGSTHDSGEGYIMVDSMNDMSQYRVLYDSMPDR